MRKLSWKIWLFAFSLSAGSTVIANPADLDALESSSRRIDFRLFYPLPQLQDVGSTSVTRRQDGTAGVGLKYHFYYTDYFGVSVSPSVWFLPVRVNQSKQTLYGLSMELGLVGRPLPDSYMDPGLSLSSGITGMSVGGGIARSFTPPLISGLDFNVYRDTNRFRDTELALNISGRATYYPQPIAAIKPWFYDFGISFRGSF